MKPKFKKCPHCGCENHVRQLECSACDKNLPYKKAEAEPAPEKLTAERRKCVTELFEQISRLRHTILFCENQLLEKEIAVKQLLDL
jgi:hypothetical protein